MLRKFRGVSFGIFFSSLVFVSALAFYGCSDGGSGGDSSTASQPAPGNNGKNGGQEVVDSSRIIKLSDVPVGYASVTAQTGTGTTVSTKSGLLAALSKGGLIYVKGTIDMSEGMLPSEAGGSTTKLDDFVKTQTTSLNSNHSDLYPNVYTKYVDFKNAYANLCSSSTDDKSSSSTTTALSRTLWKLNPEYGKIIKINVGSNTTIIGLADAVIKGGTFQISNASNVIIRNITIKDAYDPFPHHEKNDGFNAQWDCISIDSSTNVWIDYCTLEDTMKYSTVSTSSGSEKWQTYDGLCDIKGGATNITVSNCVFKNHDKTMLIGSDDTENVTVTRQVTLHHNYFLNCGQRLPMVRITNIHVFNNLYDTDSNNYYGQQYAIGVRAKAQIIAENNYFGNGISKAFNGSSNTTEVKLGGVKTNMVADTKLYESGNMNGKKSNTSYYTVVTEKPFVPYYEYTLESASETKTSVLANAGAGCTLAD